MKNTPSPANKSLDLEKNGVCSRPALLTEQGQVFEIPAGGSLGLLALGYLGLMAWRDVRRNTSNSTS